MLNRVAVIGAGMAGASCAAQLRADGVEVDVFERGRAPGGRLAAPTIGGRRVDLGAAYFTVVDERFCGVVDIWRDAGLAREWTDTLDVLTREGRSSTSGPMRWAAPAGLRSLVRALRPNARTGHEVTDLATLDHDAVVLAMPDPQAARLAPDLLDWVDYQPVITVVGRWDERCWTLPAAAFVNDDPDITLVADDGARRGDGAPVLVVHTSAGLARRHLDDPDAAIEPAIAAVRRALDLPRPPVDVRAHRWRFAQPADTHGYEAFALRELAGRPVGVCGDSWCPSGSPRVEAAWLSGLRLAQALAADPG